MKIPKSVRDAHATGKELFDRLRRRVDALFRERKEERWHYESRVKGLESFALKIETGRYSDPSLLEDFFACTIVVDNLSSMSKAEQMVTRLFPLHERRPKNDELTTKPSDSFRFDDTRLYVKWEDDPNVPATGLHGLVFEVQVKTFLAHAWTIATHDLTFKADEISWPKERIAFQVKAMLEHAEVSIQEAGTLATATCLKRSHEQYRRISAIIELIKDLWPPDSLPQDKKRLAKNINSLIDSVKIELPRLREILEEETRQGRGAHTLNLSPFLAIAQSLFNQEATKMEAYLTGGKGKFKLFVPTELELPEPLSSATLTKAIRYRPDGVNPAVAG